MPLSLSHLAEPVFTELVNKQPERFLSFCGLADQADFMFVRSARSVASCEVPLARFGQRAFDGACRIDVLVRLRPDLATAFELKLGITRLTKTRVDNEWLRPCKSSHGGRRWSGNMMAVLDRKFSEEIDGELLATPPDGSYRLTRVWFVVVRRAVKEAWDRVQPSFSTFARTLAVEDVIEHLGGREVFNAVVGGMVDIDFYDEWRVGDTTTR